MPPLPPLRELHLDDPADVELLKACIGALYSELFGPSAVPDAAAWARLCEQNAGGSTPKHWSFVACDDAAKPLAFVMLAESFAVFARGRYGIINELWVHPDARSSGAGARVIEFVRAFARLQGWVRVDVSAPQDPRWDRSVAFYRAQGFVPTGRKLKILVEAE
ncbi:MAG TPA: GNAT family N-acetyltransferase [Polyangiaceae bacterium]|nr:GNAT family N-acetyltransferase [Polyangiaceae bacterium]